MTPPRTSNVAQSTNHHSGAEMRRLWRCTQRVRVLVATLIALTALTPTPTRAQDGDDFYKGKSVNMTIGFSVGGGYDLYARHLARHIGKHIPGNPTIVPQNMAGAGSLRAANYLYTVA